MRALEIVRAWFTPPAALVLAARELEDAKRGLLSAQSSREYADDMVKYYESKIKHLAVIHKALRLNSYLKEAGE
jgi:hypothetical protein